MRVIPSDFGRWKVLGETVSSKSLAPFPVSRLLQNPTNFVSQKMERERGGGEKEESGMMLLK